MSRKRKHIPKRVRQAVYRKYDGHCAYCGKPIAYSDMQVDHFEPVAWCRGGDEYDNLMPSCRQCNYYKDTFSLEGFRKRLQSVVKNLRERQFIYNMAVKYGLVRETGRDVEFYFETHQPDDSARDGL